MRASKTRASQYIGPYRNILLGGSAIKKKSFNVSNGGKHVPAGIPFIYSRKHTSWENEEYYIKKYLPLFAELPQQSFDRIAKDLALLNKKNQNQDIMCLIIKIQTILS